MQLQTEGRQRVVSVQQCQSWDTQEGHGSLHEHWLVTAEGHRAAPSPGLPRDANHTEGRNHTQCEATQAAAPWLCTHQELH